MRFSFLIVPCTACCLFSAGQDTIEVVERSIRVAAMSDASEYYGFAAGDKIIFDFRVEKGKELKELIISEYPGTVKFSQHTVEWVENKVLEIPRQGIYKIDYYNSNILPRVVYVRIRRVPKDASTRAFNTNVKWVEKTDTAYRTQDAAYQLRSDTSFLEVFDSRVKVNAKSSSDNTHRSLLDFTLPANTLRWAYWIGVGEKGRQCLEQDQQKLSGQGNTSGSTNPLAAVLRGQAGMTQVKVGENIRYFFISKPEETRKFLDGAGFGQFRQGDMVADYGLMNYANKNSQQYFLGLSNSNTSQALEVHVKIMAMVVIKQYESSSRDLPVMSTSKVPVHEQ